MQPVLVQVAPSKPWGLLIHFSHRYTGPSVHASVRRQSWRTHRPHPQHTVPTKLAIILASDPSEYSRFSLDSPKAGIKDTPQGVHQDAGDAARGLARGGLEGIVLPIDPTKEGRFDHRYSVVDTMLCLIGGSAHNEAS